VNGDLTVARFVFRQRTTAQESLRHSWICSTDTNDEEFQEELPDSLDEEHEEDDSANESPLEHAH
jgi:hypothetical protein